MRLLAVETSGKACSAALYQGETLLGELYGDTGLTHSEKLLPFIDRLMEACEMEPKELDALAVSIGPGSFTGLRIGVASMQGVGQALSIPIAPVPSLRALAYGGRAFPGIVCPMMDARRNHVYTALYREGQEILAPTPLSMEALLEVLFPYGEAVYFLGDGVPLHREVLGQQLPVARFALPALMLPRASWVGAVALEENHFLSPAQMDIQYLRASQAERLRQEREDA